MRRAPIPRISFQLLNSAASISPVATPQCADAKAQPVEIDEDPDFKAAKSSSQSESTRTANAHGIRGPPALLLTRAQVLDLVGVSHTTL